MPTRGVVKIVSKRLCQNIIIQRKNSISVISFELAHEECVITHLKTLLLPPLHIYAPPNFFFYFKTNFE